MTKKDFIKAVAAKTGYSQKDILSVVDATFDTIKDAMVAGDDVTIQGFAKFGVRECAERTGRDPQTGAPITIPAHKAVKISASPILKNAVK